jgi:hypothetical protein
MKEGQEPTVEYNREDKDASRDLWRLKAPETFKKLIEAEEKK